MVNGCSEHGKLHGEAMVHAHILPQVAGGMLSHAQASYKKKKKKMVILKI